MKDIKRVCEVKQGKKYIVSFVERDENEVYRWLASDLINKKLCECRYIKRIIRKSNYDGTQDIIVYYDNYVRNTYTVKN